MRAFIVILFWLVLGYFYWNAKDTCCPAELPSAISLENSNSNKQSENKVLPVTANEKGELVSLPIFFNKSNVSYQSDTSLITKIEELTSKMESGDMAIITGIAYSDETNPEELALIRAKEFQRLLPFRDSQVELRAEVISEPHNSKSSFILYETKSKAVKEEADSDKKEGGATILEEENKSYFFMNRDYDRKDIPAELDTHLEKTANRMLGQISTIYLVSYSDDKSQSRKWIRYAENCLIRRGVIPNRIKVIMNKQGDRENEILELVIRD